MKLRLVPIILLLAITGGCDLYRPQQSFRLAIPEKDYFHNYMANHLRPFLERHGYHIEMVTAPTAIEANRLVASGKADLCFLNNHSVPITNALGPETGTLRTVLPLTTRLLFAFSKKELPETATAKELFENSRIGIEVLQGEAQLDIEQLLARAQISGAQVVTLEDNPDVIVFWGTLYGRRATKYLADGWHPFSFKQNWIDFFTLNYPALRPYTLPSIPGNPKSIPIHTLATEVILVTRESIGENAVYKLAEVIQQNKMELMHEDIMYRSINESFDAQSLLYPLHEGAASFLRRDEPSFFERYADTIALVLSVLAVAYGSIQTIRSNIARKKKDQVDRYFLEFLEIRQSKETDLSQKIKSLDELFQRAVEQMTNEKLDKADFHIFSRLIQQELTMLRMK